MDTKVDRHLLTIITLLSALGLMMVFSVSSMSQITHATVSLIKFVKQLFWIFTGLVLMFSINFISTTTIRKLVPSLFFFGVLAMILVLFIGAEINGSKRWFNLNLLLLQPWEFVKIAVLIYIADTLSRREDQLEKFQNGLLPIMIILAGFGFLLVMQPDFSDAVIFSAAVFGVLLASRIPKFHVVPVALLFGSTFIMLIFKMSYRLARFRDFLEPISGPFGSQTSQGAIAFGSGGIWGVGYAASKMKLLNLQASDTDFIFSIIGEEFGFIGVTIVLFLFLLLFMRMMKIVRSTKNQFLYYLALGLTMLIFVNFAVNIATVLKLFPATGVPLPFVSYGGSHLWSEFIMCGILMRIAGESNMVTEH